MLGTRPCAQAMGNVEGKISILAEPESGVRAVRGSEGEGPRGCQAHRGDPFLASGPVSDAISDLTHTTSNSVF